MFSNDIYTVEVNMVEIKIGSRGPANICLISYSLKKNYPHNRPQRPIGLRDVEVPTLCRQSAHR
jgi:hypothetical protein